MSTQYTPSVLKPKLKVGYYHHDHWRDINGSAVPFRENLTIPHVCIYGKDGSGSWSTTDFVYATTCHEVAHVSHWEMIGEGAFAILWLKAKTRIIQESWALTVQWMFTNNEYRKMLNIYNLQSLKEYNYRDGYQKWDKGSDNYYTPLFIDFIDEYNQKQRIGGDRPNDRISGYSISSLEMILFGVRDFTLLRSFLKQNKPQNVTNDDVDNLIDFYSNL